MFKKLITAFAFILFLSGCSGEKIDCQNSEALDILRDTFKSGNTGYFFTIGRSHFFIETLKRAGVAVPNNKNKHEDNEAYLAAQGKLKISFDNIKTLDINDSINKFFCESDIIFTFPNQLGDELSFTSKNVRYNVYPMNGGEKIGVEYDNDFRVNVRIKLMRIFAEIAGLQNNEDIIFSKEEFEIIKKQMAIEAEEKKIEDEKRAKMAEIRNQYFDNSSRHFAPPFAII